MIYHLLRAYSLAALQTAAVYDIVSYCAAAGAGEIDAA